MKSCSSLLAWIFLYTLLVVLRSKLQLGLNLFHTQSISLKNSRPVLQEPFHCVSYFLKILSYYKHINYF